ncbi:MAG: tetratricopeptide repeat protein, partial [Candidatus Latescibacteria bacterium]|nr:tetratricopeptide repeat protein [Candidatus Latescibacterota bacterium]
MIIGIRKKKILISGAALIVLLLSAVSASALDFKQKLNTASVYLETGKPDSAAVLLYDIVDSVEDTGDRVRALYYLAQAAGQLGRYSEERYYLGIASKLSPEVEYADNVRYSYSRILLDNGELDDCLALTREFIQYYDNSPLMPEVLYMSGIAYLMTKEYQRASNSFNEITKRYPDSEIAGEAVMKEGVCLFNLGLLAGAVENFEKYLVERPDGKNIDEALYFLGRAYEQIEQPRPAGNAFLRLTLDYPSYEWIMDAYFRLGKNFFESGRFVEAENAFINFITNSARTDNNYDEALYYLERIKFKTGEYYDETQIAENFIDKYPESPRSPMLLFELARYNNLSGRKSRAIDYYQVLMNNPLYAAYSDSSAFLLADLYVSMGNNDKAASFLLGRAFENSNTLSAQKMYYKLGSLYEEQEWYDTAIAWYDSSVAVNISPEYSVDALYGIGRSFTKVNRFMDAERTYKRIVNEYPDNPYNFEIYQKLADLFFQQGLINEAIYASENAL